MTFNQANQILNWFKVLINLTLFKVEQVIIVAFLPPGKELRIDSSELLVNLLILDEVLCETRLRSVMSGRFQFVFKQQSHYSVISSLI